MKRVMGNRRIVAVFIAILAFFLSGCGETDVNVLVEGKQQESGIVSEMNTLMQDGIPELWYRTCLVCKRWAPVIIVGCILLGILLIEIFKTKEIQKFALTVLILKIPLVVILFVYVYSFLYGVFNL